MNKSIQILSILFVFLSFSSCDSNDDTVVKGTLSARYTYVKESGMITFINTSENADSYVWDFGDGTSSTLRNPVKTFTETGDYLVKLTATSSKTGATDSFTSTISIFVFQGGLIINGDFENGTASWSFGVANPLPPGLLVTEDGNTYFSINVAAAGNPFDVNMSQLGLNLTQGSTYRLTFDAWSDVNRSIVVGIGLSANPWTNQSVTQNLTTVVQNYTIDLVANFTNTNARVIFDLGAAVGRVNIDNVTLNLVP
ncbi:MAG: carbohydrate binding domain-containing protein [Flavobacterium sp.]